MLGEDTQTLLFRGRRSRNKVSVGEPAEGSLSFLHPHRAYWFSFIGLPSPRFLTLEAARFLPCPSWWGGEGASTPLRRIRVDDVHMCVHRSSPWSASGAFSVPAPGSEACPRASDRIEITQLAPMDILA